MSGTANLGIEYIEEDAQRPEVVVNAGFDAIDAALTAPLGAAITVDDSNAASLSAEDFASAFFFTVAAGSPAPTDKIVVTVAAKARGLFAFINSTAQVVQVTVAGQAGAPPSVPPGQLIAMSCDGVAVRGRASPRIAWCGRQHGVPSAGDIILEVVLDGATAFAVNFSGSVGKAKVAATLQSDCAITLEHSGVETNVGIMRFAAASAVPAFVAPAATDGARGDVLRVYAPNPPDATLSDIAATIVAGS